MFDADAGCQIAILYLKACFSIFQWLKDVKRFHIFLRCLNRTCKPRATEPEPDSKLGTLTCVFSLHREGKQQLRSWRRQHEAWKTGMGTSRFWWVGSMGVSENVVYPKKPNGFADHYPYEKWL